MNYDVIIIGGGASALMLAANLDFNEICSPDPSGAAPSDAAEPASHPRGLILEKTSQCGTKLLMSGGGRCNITHGGQIKEFISAYGEAGPKLRKCLYRHSNAELASWLEDRGIALADEKGNTISSSALYDPSGTTGRIFPASMKASDVLNVLLEKAKTNGWELRTEAEVYEIKRCTCSGGKGPSDGWVIKASPSMKLYTRSIVIATGGITFPETGSDGSMFDILRELGIEVIRLRPALAPIYVDDYPYEELSGISLQDVTVRVTASQTEDTGRNKPVRMTGDLLFTHRGFSGPVILNISRYAEPGSTLRLNYNSDLSALPKRMQHTLENRSKGPSGDIRTAKLTALLENDDFTVSEVDMNGMVTAGGIALDEIDTTSMRIPKLSSCGSAVYAIGEAIDADGITGGYNLQMCWSTACTAADDIKASSI